MKQVIVAVVLLVSVAAVADEIVNNFVRVNNFNTGLVPASTGQGATSNAGPLVKVSCPQDSYVGASNADAGNSCAIMADGGIPCDFIQFSLGKRFYAKMLTGQNHVSAWMIDGGVQTCTTFEARN